MGEGEGSTLGEGDGAPLGSELGPADGLADGLAVGAADGVDDGAADGVDEGAALGAADGKDEGAAVGATDGLALGAALGKELGLELGAPLGNEDGQEEGSDDGACASASDQQKIAQRSTPRWARAGQPMLRNAGIKVQLASLTSLISKPAWSFVRSLCPILSLALRLRPRAADRPQRIDAARLIYESRRG